MTTIRTIAAAILFSSLGLGAVLGVIELRSTPLECVIDALARSFDSTLFSIPASSPFRIGA